MRSFIILLLTLWSFSVRAQTIMTTWCGNGSPASTGNGGPATSASVHDPAGLVFDAAGNGYVSEYFAHSVRKVSSSGIISAFAGIPGSPGFSGDGGPATSAQLSAPTTLTKDAAGNIYISDYLNYRIRKVSPSGIITTFAGNGISASSGDGGLATSASIYGPIGMDFDPAGNLIVSDYNAFCIRKITPAGIISTIAGTAGVGGSSGDGGPATAALFWHVWGLKVDAAGNIYLADASNHKIRKISTTGIVTTIAGTGVAGFSGDGGPATSARLNNPSDIDIDAAGNIYISDQQNYRVRMINTAGIISTVTGLGVAAYSGDCGPPPLAKINNTVDLVIGPANELYFCDDQNNRVRHITTCSSIMSFTGSDSVCVGSTTTLTESAVSGTWTSLNTSVATVGSLSGIVTGVAAGTATIRFTYATCCTRDTVVNVFAGPANITGDSVICLGSTGTLTNATPGGTWSASNPSVVSIGSATGFATGIAVGTTMITYGNAAWGCSVTKPVTVNPAVAAITGSLQGCAGATSTLSSAPSGGVWASSNAATGTITPGGVVTAIAAGTTTISYSMNGVGCMNTAVFTVNPVPTITGTTTICTGSSITLTGAPALGTWSSSNTGVATVGTSTGVVTGAGAGTASVVYTEPAHGCTASAVVSVNTTPSAISGTLAVCQFSTTTLSDALAGGAWSSNNTGVATINPASGIATGVAAGTATITYIRLGCFVTAVITVNQSPTAITGASSVCMGSTITLTGNPAGGTWASGSTSVATIGTSGNVLPVSAGTATVTYTLATGCSRTTVITVNALPAPITGVAPLCIGSSVTLSSATSGGNWSSSSTSIATVGAGSGVVLAVAAGTTTISYTSTNGCVITTIETVDPSPIPLSAIVVLGDTVLCATSFAALTASTGSGFMYQWMVDGSPIPGATASTYITTTPGDYDVMISNALGCAALSATKTITANPASASITTAAATFDLCTGSSLTLDANTGVGLSYQWLQDGIALAGATSASYNAGVGGTYSVVVTNSSGCSAGASVEVADHPTPPGLLTIAGPTTFCVGSSVVFTADAGPGISYQWYNAAGPIAGATNVSYTVTATGTYWVYEVTGFGCVAASSTMAVNVGTPPDASIHAGGPLVFCTGGSVALSATASAGLTFQWYKNSVAIAGATNGSFNATSTGGYRVRVTNMTTGCMSMTPTAVNITVIDNPSIVPLSPATFCWGGSALLGTSVPASVSGVSYTWYSGSSLIVGATASTYNVTVPGSYSVKITVSPGCVRVTSAVDIYEKPLPNPLVTYNSGTRVLKAQSYFVTYQWYKDLVIMPGATSNTAVATGNGQYKVKVTDTNGCQSFSAGYPITNWSGNGSTAGIVIEDGINVSLYPNPTARVVHISADVPINLVISSLDGRRVIAREGLNNTDISVAELANGVYVASIFYNGRLIRVEKLVKAGN
jgi:uncharacterized protein YjdB